MSNIQIQDIDQRIQYTATSSQTVFSVPFPFLANSDLVVYQNGTKLAQGASPGEYGISGAGNPTGGTVTLVTGATVNDIITIFGAQPIDRTSIYSATISNLTGSDLNNDFNREIIMLKQLWTTQNLLQLQYQPYAEVSQDETVTIDRWIPKLAAKQAWRMNAAGTAIEAIDFDEGGGGAPTDAQYFLATSDGGLPSGVNLGALTTGLLKHTVSAGVSTPATAVNGTDYWAPGDALTRSSAPSSGSDVTNKTYVDALVNGFTFLNPVRVASTANFASTYDNVATPPSGVGATLTASSNGAASIDGVSLALNDRVLFKDQTTTYENGVYYVSTVGDGSNPAVYTRTTDFDEPSQIDPGELVNVLAGTANAETFWIQTATVTTIGTDAITFSLFGANPNNIMTLSGTQTVTGTKTFNALTLGGDINVSTFGFDDVNGNELLTYTTTASAVNEVDISNAATGGDPTISATGDDTDITLKLAGKGTGSAAVEGTSTNDNADAGDVGEFISSSVLSGSAVSLTSSVAANITSISLTAGDWDISCSGFFTAGGGTTTSYRNIAINTTSATEPTAAAENNMAGGNISWGAGQVDWQNVGTFRLSVSGTTTLYMVGVATFAVSTMSAYGFISARRVR